MTFYDFYDKKSTKINLVLYIKFVNQFKENIGITLIILGIALMPSFGFADEPTLPAECPLGEYNVIVDADGTSGNDFITVGNGNSMNIDGKGGNDCIVVGNSNIGNIKGSGGNNIIIVGNNNLGDVFGGTGSDKFSTGLDKVYIGDNNGGRVEGDGGDDVISIGDNNNGLVRGRGGVDNITIGDDNGGDVELNGGNDILQIGNDNSGDITGGTGNDFIILGENNSGNIAGDGGDDTIVYGYGNIGTIEAETAIAVPPAPSATPLLGIYNFIQKISLFSDGADSVRYTANGSTPDCLTGALYESPISIFSTKTITAVGCEQGYTSPVASFLYTIEKIEVVPLDLQTLLTENVFVLQTGSVSATTKITVAQNIEIKVASSSESKIVLVKDLEISRIDDEVFDANLLTSSKTEAGSLSGLVEGNVVRGALQWGIVGVSLKFSEPIGISINVGGDLNGETLNIVRSVTGTSEWTSDGIVVPATCVVADDICSFQATMASYYAVYSEEEEEEAPTQTNNFGGGGSSGGGVPCYCIPEINYQNDEEVTVEQVDAQEDTIEEEIASKSPENAFEENNTALESETSITPNEVNDEERLVDTLEGVLLVSDNLDKGNLMLLFGNSVVYVKTSRGFNGLMGKNVAVSIKGTLDNFIILGMKETGRPAVEHPSAEVDRLRAEIDSALSQRNGDGKLFVVSIFASIGRMIFRLLPFF